MAKKSGEFRFRRGDSIGKADAINDSLFLDECFVDTGDLEVLLDPKENITIIVGRTGSGKTALLTRIEKNAPDHTLCISPESLSLTYITNRDTVRTLIELGVSLDPFFKLLWKHVLSLQVLLLLYPPTANDKQQGFFSYIMSRIRFDKTSQDKELRHKRVVEYIHEHSHDQFWEDCSLQVERVVDKFETNIRKETGTTASIGGGAKSSALKFKSKISQDTSEQSAEATFSQVEAIGRERFQEIVNSILLRDIEKVTDLLRDVFDDAAHNVYIVIDKLDTNWVDEQIRFRLIKALIEVAIQFSTIAGLKIYLAMRYDLLERIYRDASKEPGTQWEKVKDHCLFIHWNRHSLEMMLDQRVGKLVRDRYAPSQNVRARDIVPAKIKKGNQKGKATIDFIFDRTWMRPRDLLEFFNNCIVLADGKAAISEDIIRAAETRYSADRLQSLSEEWQLEYPYIRETCEAILHKRPRRFQACQITPDQMYSWALDVLSKPTYKYDRLVSLAQQCELQVPDYDGIRSRLLEILYYVGAIGIQYDSDERPQWSMNVGGAVTAANMTVSTVIYPHDALWSALGIKD